MYFSVFEWSENETHASEIREYLLTPQTKSLEILNLSCSCFSPSHLEKWEANLQCQSDDIFKNLHFTVFKKYLQIGVADWLPITT